MGLPGITWVPIIFGILAVILLIIAAIFMVIYSDKSQSIPSWTWWMFAIGVIVILICLIWIGIHGRNYGLDVAEVETQKMCRAAPIKTSIEIPASGMPTSDGDENTDDYGLNAIEETYTVPQRQMSSSNTGRLTATQNLKNIQILV